VQGSRGPVLPSDPAADRGCSKPPHLRGSRHVCNGCRCAVRERICCTQAAAGGQVSALSSGWSLARCSCPLPRFAYLYVACWCMTLPAYLVSCVHRPAAGMGAPPSPLAGCRPPHQSIPVHLPICGTCSVSASDTDVHCVSAARCMTQQGCTRVASSKKRTWSARSAMLWCRTSVRRWRTRRQRARSSRCRAVASAVQCRS
jgi:hypothetical protein